MTTMTINAKNRTIEMTKKFATAAAKFGTDEYKQLQEARRDYPTFKVVTVTRKAAKSAFKGLTFKYMEKYIAAHDNEDKSIMAEYKKLRAQFDEEDDENIKVLAESASYMEIKDWFLKKFPEIKKFHEDRAKILAA